ncbi:hypothetical protein QBC43DRAFT_142467 [Cladorrhinum sp. PSN259]|nr:hypothetical protein QBC43DRAFT_142467 [Cladorrhinum sp. PSN259]
MPANQSRSSHSVPPSPPCLLACPYYRLHPHRHRSCGGKKLRHNSDIRTHLHRCHTQPVFCPICKTVFKGKDAYNNRHYHIAAQKCQHKWEPYPDGLTPDDFVLIAEKKEIAPFQGLTALARQWYAIWEVCCRGEPFPPPDLIYQTRPSQDHHAGQPVWNAGYEERRGQGGEVSLPPQVPSVLPSLDFEPPLEYGTQQPQPLSPQYGTGFGRTHHYHPGNLNSQYQGPGYGLPLATTEGQNFDELQVDLTMPGFEDLSPGVNPVIWGPVYPDGETYFYH